MEKVDINALVKGMHLSEIINELHDKVSGETSQELQMFFETYPALYSQHSIDLKKSHEVVMAEDNYALILKYAEIEVPEEYEEMGTESVIVGHEKTHWWEEKEFALPIYKEVAKLLKKTRLVKTLSKLFYLVGINDEHRYFVHRLEGIPEEKTRKLEDILSWVNRRDEGFLTRLQGDLVIMYIPKLATAYHGIGLDIARPVLKSNRTNTYQRTQVVLGTHIISPIASSISSENNTISVFDDKYVLVGGKGLIIQHAEHGFLKHEFPEGHYGLVTGQRGRDLSVEKNQGFD